MEESQGRFRPVVSVVIVNFNCGQLLSVTVRALLASPVPLEVIVADNGSSDGSVGALRNRLGAHPHPRVRIIENAQNLGFARANNRIIPQAKGDYILLLNPDCVVYPDTITNMLAAMEAHPQRGDVSADPGASASWSGDVHDSVREPGDGLGSGE